jgi:hypothetical protein
LQRLWQRFLRCWRPCFENGFRRGYSRRYWFSHWLTRAGPRLHQTSTTLLLTSNAIRRQSLASRRMSPATDTQVVLREVAIPNAAGTYIWQSAGDIPLPVRHEALLRPGRVIGRPLKCDLCNVYQRSSPQKGAPPVFGLAIPVPIKDVPLQECSLLTGTRRSPAGHFQDTTRTRAY